MACIALNMPSRQRAVFTGVARDCAEHLPIVLENLARLSALYAEASFVFVVSDTNDQSRSSLERWLATGRRGRVVDLGILADRLPKRTERLACARNACLDEIRRSEWPAYDHLVVADLDDVLASPVSAHSFAEAADWLDAAPSRAGVFANSSPRYYDIWALRHATWCPDDCWHSIWGRDPKETFEAAKFRESYARQIVIPPSLPPIGVRSAFGGLGLYKMRFTLGARYRGVDARGREVSEHVAFNETIGRAGGQFHIFPPLMVRAPQEHLYRASDFPRRWRWAMFRQRAFERLRPPWREFFPR
jgi:hypothetical protein